jgi:hypothetical protein
MPAAALQAKKRMKMDLLMPYAPLRAQKGMKNIESLNVSVDLSLALPLVGE